MLSLMRRIFGMPFPWNIWVMLLGFVNLGGGLFFFSTLEGKFALGSMVGAMIVMQIVYSKYGFVRLLGLGHILFWLPFLAWSICRLRSWSDLQSEFRLWLLLVSTMNAFSLLIDAMDVWRYVKGERAEI